MIKFSYFIFLISLITSVSAHATSYNQLRLTLDPTEYATATRTAQKYDFTHAELAVNGGPAQAALVNIRGQNCLKSPRRCLGVKVENQITLNGVNKFSAKNINLVSMWEDQGYISSRIGYEMFKALGFFNLPSEYAEVFINGKSFGLYLVTQKPKKAVEQYVDKPFVARRGIELRFEVAEEAPPGSKHTDAEYLAAFQKLMSDLKLFSGQALERRIEQTLDLPVYMNWLVVNSLLKNGDYSDEVFFYTDTQERDIRFSVFPWDMDDLFRPPHAGPLNKRYTNELATTLLYSYENPIDIKIGKDPVLYKTLQLHASPILQKLASDALIDQVIESVRTAIAPYLELESVFEGSRLDHKGRAYTRDGILKLLESRRLQIKERREVLKTRL